MSNTNENDLDMARLRIKDAESVMIVTKDPVEYIKRYFQVNPYFYPCTYTIGDREITA